MPRRALGGITATALGTDRAPAQPEQVRATEHAQHIKRAAADFPVFVEQLRGANVKEWRDNRSEGASFYFLDPDGHKLETHVGDLASRLQACRQRPYAGMKFFDDQH